LRPVPDTSGAELEMILVFVGTALGVFLCCMFAMYRFREQCLNLFRYFLVLEFVLIYAFSAGALMFLFTFDFAIPIDLFSFFFVLFNITVIGVLSMYLSQFPEWLRHVYLILLNIGMTMMLFSFDSLFLLVFVSISVIVDCFSILRPDVNIFSPFILPTNFQLLYDTPRVLYHVGGLRMRAVDMMWYGLMVRFVPADTLSLTLAFWSIISSLAIVVFVSPYEGKSVWRPLPFAFLFAVIIVLFSDTVFTPFNNAFISTGAMV
jgi:hypothetical protein